jgi:hypothetical protein
VSLFAKIREERRRAKPLKFVTPSEAFEPQVEVRMLKDVTGWVDRGRREKFHLGAQRTYMVDEQTAVEFITKGYAAGELPREVSEDERAEIRSVMTTIGVGANE